MKKTIRIGSRESMLAVWQAEYIKKIIEAHHPDIYCEIITMKTTGDRMLGGPLDQAGGKGLFVKELDASLLRGDTDISVHSLKDMPAEIPEELPLLAYSLREDPRDALILRKGMKENELRVIGTSSKRRAVQLEMLYPGCRITGIRGNVQTRLAKLDEGLCDATILAAAGLKRLGREGVIARIYSTDEMLPAAGQGILAVQGRAGEDHSYLECVMDQESRIAAEAERSFIKTLDGGCSSPIAAYAGVREGRVLLKGMYCDEESKETAMGTAEGSVGDARLIGEELAVRLKES